MLNLLCDKLASSFASLIVSSEMPKSPGVRRGLTIRHVFAVCCEAVRGYCYASTPTVPRRFESAFGLLVAYLDAGGFARREGRL